MIYLGRHTHPLINQDDQFEAWDYGPVLPKLYHQVKIFGNDPIQDIFYWPESPENNETKFLEESYGHFLDKNPYQFVAMTHRPNGAWAKNYEPHVRGKKIPDKDIKKEYEQINEG